jgi:hypothetical protein
LVRFLLLPFDDTVLRRDFQRSGVEREIASRSWEFAKELALAFLPFSCSPSTIRSKQTVGVREQPWAASVPSMAEFERRCRASRLGNEREPLLELGRRKKEEPNLCFLCSGAHVLTGSQLTKFESALRQMNIGSGYWGCITGVRSPSKSRDSWLLAFAMLNPSLLLRPFLDNQWQG